MGMQRSHADPCLYFAWTEDGLVIWVSWIDDYLVVGSDKAVAKVKRAMMGRFECEDVGDIVEYVGCKIDIDRETQTLKFTQPVLLQSYEDEFDLPNAVPMTATTPRIGVAKRRLRTDDGRITVQISFRSGQAVPHDSLVDSTHLQCNQRLLKEYANGHHGTL